MFPSFLEAFHSAYETLLYYVSDFLNLNDFFINYREAVYLIEDFAAMIPDALLFYIPSTIESFSLPLIFPGS